MEHPLSSANHISKSISFEVDFHNTRPHHVMKPQRHDTRQLLTTQMLEEKQRQAEERRKAHEAARLERINKRQEECRKLNKNIAVLLAQQAKVQGEAGTESVKSLSKNQVNVMGKKVMKDFENITAGIQLESSSTQ